VANFEQTTFNKTSVTRVWWDVADTDERWFAGIFPLGPWDELLGVADLDVGVSDAQRKLLQSFITAKCFGVDTPANTVCFEGADANQHFLSAAFVNTPATHVQLDIGEEWQRRRFQDGIASVPHWSNLVVCVHTTAGGNIHALSTRFFQWLCMWLTEDRAPSVGGTRSIWVLAPSTAASKLPELVQSSRGMIAAFELQLEERGRFGTLAAEGLTDKAWVIIKYDLIATTSATASAGTPIEQAAKRLKRADSTSKDSGAVNGAAAAAAATEVGGDARKRKRGAEEVSIHVWVRRWWQVQSHTKKTKRSSFVISSDDMNFNRQGEVYNS
jgi:hypothetical protein